MPIGWLPGEIQESHASQDVILLRPQEGGEAIYRDLMAANHGYKRFAVRAETRHVMAKGKQQLHMAFHFTLTAGGARILSLQLSLGVCVYGRARDDDRHDEGYERVHRPRMTSATAPDFRGKGDTYQGLR